MTSIPPKPEQWAPERARAFHEETVGRVEAEGERLVLTVQSGVAWGMPGVPGR